MYHFKGLICVQCFQQRNCHIERNVILLLLHVHLPSPFISDFWVPLKFPGSVTELHKQGILNTKIDIYGEGGRCTTHILKATSIPFYCQLFQRKRTAYMLFPILYYEKNMYNRIYYLIPYCLHTEATL